MEPQRPAQDQRLARAFEVIDRACASYSGTRSDHRALESAQALLAGEIQRLREELVKATAPPAPPVVGGGEIADPTVQEPVPPASEPAVQEPLPPPTEPAVAEDSVPEESVQ